MREPNLKLPTPAALQRTEDSLVKQQALLIIGLERALIKKQEEIDRLRHRTEHEGI